MTWHETAEAAAYQAVAPAVDVPTVTYDQLVKPGAALFVVVLPSTMTGSYGSSAGSVRASMTVQLAAAAGGDVGAPVGALTALVDTIVTALYRAGFRDVTTAAGYSDIPELANPRPSRTVTATIEIDETL